MKPTQLKTTTSQLSSATSISGSQSRAYQSKSASNHPKTDELNHHEQPHPSIDPSDANNLPNSTLLLRNQPTIATRPLACGRRRRHTISNNHIEFMFYHCLRDEIDEEDEEDHDEDEDDDEDSSYHRIPARRQDQSLYDIHHCDVIVLKTDNGWCFDQDIFLPAWKRDAYEAAGQDDGLSGQEVVKVDEIRVD